MLKTSHVMFLVAAGLVLSPVPGAGQTDASKGRKVAITSEVLDRFITGLKAELAERDRLARANPQPDVAKYWSRQDRTAYCDSAEAADKAQQEKDVKQMQEDMMSGVQARMERAQKTIAAIQERAAHPRTCERGPEPSTEQAFFDALRAAQGQTDAVGARAAGLPVADYALLRERIAAYVMFKVNPGGAYTQAVGYAPGESAALDARVGVLLPLLKRDYTMSGARKQSYEY
jgi:hypothetical protein